MYWRNRPQTWTHAAARWSLRLMFPACWSDCRHSQALPLIGTAARKSSSLTPSYWVRFGADDNVIRFLFGSSQKTVEPWRTIA
ncbi:hypothetical protein DP49_5959 [Burkholderia pseudomallei]|nr:hypothetical protein DP49_5959 [Burkholderia pseudomallei]